MINRVIILLAAATMATGCARVGNIFQKTDGDIEQPSGFSKQEQAAGAGGQSILSLFSNADDPNVTIGVNKYIWNAALDVLSFMPVEGADPFSGVIVMGWGTPPGGGRSYRATVYVQDPALDARSLRVALVTRGGPADRDTIRAIEDAILTRARQLRIADSNL